MSDQLPENYGQGESGPEAEVNETQEVSTENTTAPSTAVTDPPAGHPAWEEALSAVPEEFHPHLRDHLGRMDKGAQDRFQKVQQQYAPYKELAELKVNPDEINEAMQFRHLLQTQPEEVFKWMQEQYKFGQAESQGQEDNAEETLELDENEAFFKDPRYVDVANKAAFAESAIQQFNQQAVDAKVNEQVRSETKQVQDEFPGLDISAVATYAIGLSQQSGKMPNLYEAAQAMSGFIPQQPAPRASDSAPPVINGNRGLPSAAAPKFGAMTSDQRSAHVAELMRASLNS